jgi:hypothetical protein
MHGPLGDPGPEERKGVAHGETRHVHLNLSRGGVALDATCERREGR